MERDPAGKRRKLETGSSTEDLRGTAPATRNGRVLTAAEIALAARPLPPRYPPFPTNGTIEDFDKYNLEIVRVHRLCLQDPARNLPTVASQEAKDPITAAVTSSLRDKNAVLKAARSMVHVTSTASDGSRDFRCTGIIVGVVSDETGGKHARILTSSRTVCTLKGVLQDPKPKLSIHLPNTTCLEGHLLFLSDHYRLALLDIMVDSLLTSASFGTSPQYGQEVFVLARDEDSSLVARRGTILFLEESSLGRNYNMFLSCEIPECGTGGPVIDHDGFVTGMAFRRNLDTAIIGISTILTCIEMWTQFRSVARPMLDMHLRSVELLDISLREQLSIQHNINRGFIVDKVTIDSAAERLGIRQGDVIVLDELYGSTLPQFEDFLLYRGWEYLRLLNIQSHLMVDLKLEVHDLLGRAKRNVTLSIGLSDASERVMKNWNKHDSRRKVSTVSPEFDPDTAAALHSQQDRNMALAAACSIVSVSSTRAGDDNVFRCTGIVVAITSSESGKCARILTSSRIFCSGDADLRLPEQKAFVHLPDKITVEGHILFINIHYRIAILEILTNYPLRHVCFGDMPQYDQEVFLLGRDEESSIVVRRGSISLLEQSFLRRNYYMFLSCESGALQDLDCTGGLVIDKYGNMMGMIVAHNLQVAIMSITTVKICIDMWDKFSRIARPMIDMDLRSVELLEIEEKEKLSVHYNIERGFIVDKVRSDSSVWKNGIGEGDVMEIIDGECGSTLPQLEDYLLKLGWGCLDKCLDQLLTMDLKIRVHDIVRQTSKDIVIALEYDLV